MSNLNTKLNLKGAEELIFGNDDSCCNSKCNYNGRSYENSSKISNKSKGIILLVVGILSALVGGGIFIFAPPAGLALIGFGSLMAICGGATIAVYKDDTEQQL